MKKIILLLMLVMILPLINAEKVNSNISIDFSCSNSTYGNISYIKNIVTSEYLIYTETTTTKKGNHYNYTLPSSLNNKIGVLEVVYHCDIDGKDTNSGYRIDITGNGKSEPDGVIIVLFIIVFLILVGLSCYLSLYTIGHLINADFDIIDLSFDLGLFFMILALYFLEDYYLGNEAIGEYLLWFISAGGIMLVLVPFIAFILSLVHGSFKQGGYKFRIPKRR
jgi:hypothetical protein